MSTKDVKIDEDIDIPDEAYVTRNGVWTLHFLDAVKKSRFYPNSTESRAKSAINNFTKQERFSNWRFFAKEMIKDGVPGVRIWRIENRDGQDENSELRAPERIRSAAETFKKHGQTS